MTPPLVVRPRRLTLVCRIVAAVSVVFFAGLGEALTRTEGELAFRTGDQVLMTLFGALVAGGVLGFTRARVVAGSDGVRVRNAFTERSLPWGVVAGVRFVPGDSWAHLDLQDDDTVALLAVQSADGEHAEEAVRRLRELLEASRR